MVHPTSSLFIANVSPTFSHHAGTVSYWMGWSYEVPSHAVFQDESFVFSSHRLPVSPSHRLRVYHLRVLVSLGLRCPPCLNMPCKPCGRSTVPNVCIPSLVQVTPCPSVAVAVSGLCFDRGASSGPNRQQAPLVHADLTRSLEHTACLFL